MSFGEGTKDGHKTVQGRTKVKEYFENIKLQKHGSVLEHATFSLLIEGVSRSLTHELVRHRAGFAYSQLSQRFVEPSNVAFVMPPALPTNDEDPKYRAWYRGCEAAEKNYAEFLRLLSVHKGMGMKEVRETARALLPNCVETKIVATANVRAWRHFLTKRGALGADGEIRRLALLVNMMLSSEAPLLFSDIHELVDDRRVRYLSVEHEAV